MNGTTVIYSDVEKGIIPLAGLVVSPIISLVIYLIARRRSKQTDTVRSKAHLFYRIISGVLLGQFIGHTVWPDSYWMLLFVAAGYFLLDTCEVVARMWNNNPNLVANADYNVDEEIGLDEETGEIGTVAISNDLTSNDFQQAVFAKQDAHKNERKRQWMFFLLLILFAVICLVNGLYLIYRLPQTPLEKMQIIICYFCNAASMSVAIYGAMLHARVHRIEGKRSRIIWWTSLTILWSVIFFAPSIMVLANTPWQWVDAMVHNPILLAFYGLAAGAILKMQTYFHVLKVEQVDKRELLLGILVFFIAFGQSMATSIWL